MKVAGKVAVVTGAASGLGLATAQSLAAGGAQVALLDRDAAAATTAATEIGTAASGHGLDVTDAEAVAATIAAIESRWGAPHILVNAAGIAPGQKITDGTTPGSLEHFRQVVEVNLIGLYDVTRHCVTLMAQNPVEDGERGVVVNVSSGAAWQGQRGQAAYAASKAGVLGLTLPVARDVARFGVRVVAIAPGLFDTAMAQGLSDDLRRSLEATVLNPSRMGRPEEFAMLVQQIVQNPYLNATTLSLDGGVRMQ